MSLFDLLKLVLTTLAQIEFSPPMWRKLGFTNSEIYAIVIPLSFILLGVTMVLLRYGVSMLGGKKKTKPGLTDKLAQRIHTFGALGLFLIGLLSFFPMGIYIASLAYLLYCQAETKVWYKPNLGLLSLVIGVLLKLIVFINFLEVP